MLKTFQQNNDYWYNTEQCIMRVSPAIAVLETDANYT